MRIGTLVTMSMEESLGNDHVPLISYGEVLGTVRRGTGVHNSGTMRDFWEMFAAESSVPTPGLLTK